MRFQIYRAEEKDLIDGCKKNDRQAQELLYKRFSGKMYGLCCRYIKDKMEAEDVLVVAFTKIFQRIDQYKGDGSFEGWIRKIIVNESLTYLRKNKNMYLELDVEAADQEPDYQQMEGKLEADDLMRLISELPTGYRIVFNMYAIDGFSHKEIADHLGIQENTSKSQLSRARVMLQRNLLELEKIASKDVSGTAR
jgi:RNA polymerase sigma factor (sigma-70 family)